MANQNTQQDANSQLDFALSQGINFIDTAEMYPVPPRAETVTRTETILGNWLKTQQRDSVVLASKSGWAAPWACSGYAAAQAH